MFCEADGPMCRGKAASGEMSGNDMALDEDLNSPGARTVTEEQGLSCNVQTKIDMRGTRKRISRNIISIASGQKASQDSSVATS